MANGHGGKRKGAGKPISSATLETQTFREALTKRINDEMESWIVPIEDLAKGHLVEKPDLTGVMRIYKKSPDANAWKAVMERAFGKSPQSIDITSKGERIVTADMLEKISRGEFYEEEDQDKEEETEGDSSPS